MSGSVYIVGRVWEDCYGAPIPSIESVWTTREQADVEADRLRTAYLGTEYEVEEHQLNVPDAYAKRKTEVR